MKDAVHHLRHVQKKVLRENRRINLDKKVIQSQSQANGNGKSKPKSVT